MENKKINYNADITNDDKQVLGKKIENKRTDRQGDDIQLENREKPVDFEGKDLDIPRRSRAKTRKPNFKDEENGLYSQGSGHNDHLEDATNHNEPL